MATSNISFKVSHGDASWCQSCLKRHVNKGYTKCMYCS